MSTDLLLLPRVAYRGKEITGPRMRTLFALLAADLRTGCSASRLVQELWWDERPEYPGKALQILVSRARSQLGAGLIASTPHGYRLALSEDQVDTSAVLLSGSASAQCLRDGDYAAALQHAESGLARWADAEAEAGDSEAVDPLSMLRAERMSTYRSLLRIRALALSRLGRYADALDILGQVFRERPQDEEVLVELLRCEAATAGPSVAITRYDAYRRSLRDELGTDPGPALQQMYHELLRGSAPVVRSGIPQEPNALLGRDDDILAVTHLMRSSRVTSIVGTGGLGKTRLAYAVSRRAEQHAVHLVPLAGVTSDDDVASAVAAALGVGDGRLTPVDLVTGIVNALGHGSALLVLDNCEHVVRGAAELVRALISMTGDLRVLTTSRARLGLSSESVYLLPELTLPASVELFNHRAKAARPTAELPLDAVQDVCGRLEGLPLAIELAAARVRIMSVPEIAVRLADRFALLRGGARDSPERHRALRAVIDWSWNLLDPPAQAAMRALSIFVGGFTADAAAHLLGTGDVLDVLTQLTDQSLLKAVDTRSGARLHMLETVREFSAVDRDADVTRRFLAWARDFGTANHDAVFGDDPVTATWLIRAEQDNLQLALRLGLDRDDGATVSAMAAVLGCLWLLESNFARLSWLTEQTQRCLSHFRPEPAHVEITRTAAVISAVNTFLMHGPRATRALVVLRRLPLGTPDTTTRAAHAMVLGPADHADTPILFWMRAGFESFLHQQHNNIDEALFAAERMLRAADTLRGPLFPAFAHSRLGELSLDADQGHRARDHLAAALPLIVQVGARSSTVRGRWALTMANLQIGAYDEAERWADEAAMPGEDDPVGLALRAEIMLGRGQVEAGLRAWRRVADRMLPGADPVMGIDTSVAEAWFIEVQGVTLVAHARHGHLGLVRDIAGTAPGLLAEVLTHRPSTVNFPSYGSLLLGIAAADIADGRPGAGMVALAERFRFSRGYQPTMSPARAREMAEQSDKAAYADAQSAYAALDSGSLVAAALTALRERISG
ncbi:BTAD domain-containing putative transcriptional regulator [Kibdelosporangium persicum]|uniref:Signal transduction response regulator n=1 Tax=Kibdelosporangium persicum TaxID=2698649 RepID=A0ABX2FE06_9PSEU|nr:BTAD domain-containing putative transcriptional regulator [Kibdelosporangium persicum]NRN69608.1 Signal transduction response regulator [Kibdelosporangium persicum]